MGVTMFLQQKLNPQPPDPVQAKMFMLMPLIFTFMLATFPAGLVIYWAWNNVLRSSQQWVIMNADIPEAGKVAAQQAAIRKAGGALFARRLSHSSPARLGGGAAACRFAGGRLRRPFQCRQVEPHQRARPAASRWRASPTRPGRTQQLNFFRLGGRLMLVDLPGYGFARVSKTDMAAWRTLIETYLRGRPVLRRVLLLVDARRGLMEADREAIDAARRRRDVLPARADQDRQARRRDRCRRSRPQSAPIVQASGRAPGRSGDQRGDRRGIAELRAELAALAELG